ncbi:sensor histidine kinase [Rhodothermaceae bacterium RA]|nr:sensor histidine kinase [Rhodothermaceae bacterium RA]
MAASMHLRISTRLTMWYGLTLLILLSLFALFCYLFFHASLHRDFDRHLSHETRQLMPYVQFAGGSPAFSSLDELRSVAYETDGVFGTYVRLLTPDGLVLYKSPNFAEHSPLKVRIPGETVAASVSQVWEGKPARSMYTPLLRTGEALKGWLEVTGFEWSLHQELYRLRLAMIVGIVLSVLLAIGGGSLLARRALQPVAALTEAANEIRVTNLSARLPTRFQVRDELTELAETFNALIARIEASFERERRFTDNAAHELLTPLTTLSNGIEIALRRERTPEGYRDTLRSMMEEVDEMTGTIRGLLQLARVDQLHELPREAVDLGDVVSEHVRRMQRRAAREGLDLAMEVTPGIFVLADRGRIGEVVDNLLDNAIKYTPVGGRIHVRVAHDGNEARIEVMDTGIGFDAQQQSHLFDRFYRADTPEVQARHGSGLGLSIVQTITQIYGGTVEGWSEGPSRGSLFVVRLPVVVPYR